MSNDHNIPQDPQQSLLSELWLSDFTDGRNGALAFTSHTIENDTRNFNGEQSVLVCPPYPQPNRDSSVVQLDDDDVFTNGQTCFNRVRLFAAYFGYFRTCRIIA